LMKDDGRHIATQERIGRVITLIVANTDKITAYEIPQMRYVTERRASESCNESQPIEKHDSSD